MTEQRFDQLLSAGLARALEDDLELAWAAQGPEREVLSARKRPVRRAVRLSLLAALIAVLTLGVCAAAASGFLRYWTFEAEQYVEAPGGGSRNSYHIHFDGKSFSADMGVSLENVPEIGRWYPTWLPDFPGAEWRLFAERRSPSLLPGETYVLTPVEAPAGHTGLLSYSSFSVFYLQSEVYETRHTDGELSWEEAAVGQYPAFVLRDTAYPMNRILIWYNTDRLTYFEMIYRGSSVCDLDTGTLLRIAESFQEKINET